MSEAPGPALGPETTLEGPAPSEGPSRGETLAAALDSLEAGGDTQPAPEAPQAPAEPAEPGSEPVAPPEPEPAWKSPPASWKKEYHEAWAKADPALQQYAFQREEEMRKGIEPLIPKAKFADEVNGVLTQYQQNLQAAGVPPVAAIQTLMQADHILRNAPMDQKVAYAKQLLQQYGVDMSNTDWSDVAVDPRMAALERELHNLRNTVTPIAQQQVEAQNQALLSEIETFSRDKPHFEAVRPAMVHLLQSGEASSYAEAYQKAMEPWAPILSDAEAGRQAAAEAAKRKAADDAAKAARAAAVQVRSSTPGRPPQTKAQDRRSLLAEQLDGLSERF